MSLLDELRNDFRQALGCYIQEGNTLRDLLIAARDMASPGAGMKEQQARLWDAQSRYEAARSRYVEAVLGGTLPLKSSED